ncbi:hypothetical protein ACQPZF_16930 [Actinosynnema sp. CS-041913]|uniref:hypothetical protein n=1 Tax=Actinosynnema sp. CS-041913 TaxID=3239917 RepID=UPI003D8C8C36
MSSHPLGEVRLTLLKLVAATALLVGSSGGMGAAAATGTAVVALVWRVRGTALAAVAGAVLAAWEGAEATATGALALVTGLLAAWSWWEASRLPLWPRWAYRTVRRDGYGMAPAVYAGLPMGNVVPVDLIVPDLDLLCRDHPGP